MLVAQLAVETGGTAHLAQRALQIALAAQQRGLEVEQLGLVERIAGALLEQLPGAAEVLVGGGEVAEGAVGVADMRPGAPAQIQDRPLAVGFRIEALGDLARHRGELERTARIVVHRLEGVLEQTGAEAPGVEPVAVADERPLAGVRMGREVLELDGGLGPLALDPRRPLAEVGEDPADRRRILGIGRGGLAVLAQLTQCVERLAATLAAGEHVLQNASPLGSARLPGRESQQLAGGNAAGVSGRVLGHHTASFA